MRQRHNRFLLAAPPVDDKTRPRRSLAA
jgi:hypothetical protein